jgi:hypothetical protein
MAGDNGYTVFISHSSKDRWIAQQMARLIDERTGEHGVTTFLDEKDIEGGDLFKDEIRTALRSCEELLVLLTPYSISRDWVQNEIGSAWVLEKRIVPILLHVDLDDIPDIIDDRKAFDLNDFSQYLAELSGRAREAHQQ